RLGWSGRRIIVVSALLRGAYHTYQGIGPGLANLVMGLLFGEWYRRTRRTMPLVIAHTLLDMFAFVGYALLQSVISTCDLRAPAGSRAQRMWASPSPSV